MNEDEILEEGALLTEEMGVMKFPIMEGSGLLREKTIKGKSELHISKIMDIWQSVCKFTGNKN